MQRLATAALVLFGALALLFAACGGDDGGSSGDTISDEQYLKVVCTGAEAFSDALIRETTKEGIARVVQQYVDDLKKVTPEKDLQPFHGAFVKYLEDSLSDPTALVTRRPPVPKEDARVRLVRKEPSVEECREVKFFQRLAAP